MRILCFSLAFALVTFGLHAGVLAATCFDADEKRFLQANEDFEGPENDRQLSVMPKIQESAGGDASALGWTDQPDNISNTAERVGWYKGHAIWRVIYRRPGAASLDDPAFVWVLFGYEHDTPKGPRVQPFFVANGEIIRRLESSFAASEARPFGLEIHLAIGGTMQPWEDYTFVFTPDAARLVERRAGDKTDKVKTFRYDEAGHVISTKT